MEKYTRETKLELPKLSPEKQEIADGLVREINNLKIQTEHITAELGRIRERIEVLRKERDDMPKDAGRDAREALRQKIVDQRLAAMELESELRTIQVARESFQRSYREIVFGEGRHDVH